MLEGQQQALCNTSQTPAQIVDPERLLMCNRVWYVTRASWTLLRARGSCIMGRLWSANLASRCSMALLLLGVMPL